MTGLNILIVDDEERDRRHLWQTLEKVAEKMTIQEAEDRESAIALLTDRNFDCIFLKETLADISETLQIFHQHNIQVPIILLTGGTEKKTRLEWLKVGIADTLQPREILPEILSRSLHIAIGSDRAHQETTENLRQVNARLAEQKQHLIALQKLTNLLNQNLTDLKYLLAVMAQSVSEAIAGAQFCFIALYDCQECQTSLTVTVGEDGHRLPLDRAFSVGGWLHQVFATGEATLMQTPSHPLFPFPAALYAVPIQSARSGRLGVLGVGHWQDLEAFSRGEGLLLLAVGEQAAIAIDNAQLIQTLEEREERLERQNQILAKQNSKLATQRQQIHQKNLQLIEATKMKSQFLATMSHELRTPMNAIMGFSQVLLRQRSDSLSPHQVQMIERIHNNGKNLLELINDILDLSKIEAKKLEIKLGSFNIIQLVCTTLESLRPLADEKNLALHCDCHCQIKNKEIISDRDRLRQILVNLLSNAIKFTEAGSITVKLEDMGCDRIKIIVKDTGIGIAKNRQERIFEEFYQGDQTTTRKYSGTGLGLAITKSLVELMRGKIELVSQLGQGTTFAIELPFDCSPSFASLKDGDS